MGFTAYVFSSTSMKYMLSLKWSQWPDFFQSSSESTMGVLTSP